jgi:hypothetical protein
VVPLPTPDQRLPYRRSANDRRTRERQPREARLRRQTARVLLAGAARLAIWGLSCLGAHIGPKGRTAAENCSPIGVDTAYASHVLPSLILIGVGFGLTVAPSFATATLGVPPRDSGVASAMVNTSQQVGGSIGAALLSTLAVSATTDFLTDRGPTTEVLRQAAVEGYVTAFWWAAAIFALGALVCGSLLRPGVRPAPAHGAPEPAAP